MSKIKVCENCGTPLIWTFRWDYNELYCLNCGTLGDMFIGVKKPLTKELRIKKRVVNKIWKALYGTNKPLLPDGSFHLNNCKKCNGEEHSCHLTKKEVTKNKVAIKILNQMKHLFLED